jgi:hypothetical protein
MGASGPKVSYSNPNESTLSHSIYFTVYSGLNNMADIVEATTKMVFSEILFFPIKFISSMQASD